METEYTNNSLTTVQTDTYRESDKVALGNSPRECRSLGYSAGVAALSPSNQPGYEVQRAALSPDGQTYGAEAPGSQGQEQGGDLLESQFGSEIHSPEAKFHASPATFVKAGVKHGPKSKSGLVSEKVLRKVYGKFYEGDQVISAYLDGGGGPNTDLEWKRNWHTEAVIHRIDEALAIEEKWDRSISALASYKRQLRVQRARAEKVRSTTEGFFLDTVVGTTQDGDPAALSPTVRARRWSEIKKVKRNLRKIYASMKPWNYVSRADMLNPNEWGENETEVENVRKTFMLSAANIKKSSSHQYGYAIDVAGDNDRIKASARSAGATMVYDEASHVHLEFEKHV